MCSYGGGGGHTLGEGVHKKMGSQAYTKRLLLIVVTPRESLYNVQYVNIDDSIYSSFVC